MNKKFLGLSGKVWIGVIALGVVVFIYMRRRNTAAKSAAPASATDSVGTDPTDQAQLAAGLGGTPGADSSQFDPGWFQATLDAQAQSLEDFIANSAGLAGAGISGGGGAGISGAGVGAAAPSSAGAAAPATTDQTTTTDVANPATSFLPPGTDVSGGGAPLYAYSGGNLIADSPTAGSVFSPFAPAATGYAALGVDPSAPVTFVPTPMGTSTSAPGPAPVRGTAVAV